MITYELAKKLKEAGFPQGFTEKDGLLSYTLGEFKNVQQINGELVKFPDLSELIEACGQGGYSPGELSGESLGKPFFCKLYSVIGFSKKGAWRASGAIQKEQTLLGYELTDFDEYGLTPEEAVANLWLKLNSVNQYNEDTVCS